MLCSGQRNEKFKDEIKNYIHGIMNNKVKFNSFQEEVVEIQHRINNKRLIFLNEK